MEVERVSSPGRAITPDDDDLTSGFEMLSHHYDSIAVDGTADAIDHLQLSFSSGGSDLPVEEAEKCIQDLLKENSALKELLETNGSMVRRQHETFMVLQKQLSDADRMQQDMVIRLKESEDSKKGLEKKHREELEELRRELSAKIAEIEEHTEMRCKLAGALAELETKAHTLEADKKELEEKNRTLEERYRDTISTLDLVEVRTGAGSRSCMSQEPLSTYVSGLGCGAGKEGSGLKLEEVIVHLHNEQSKTAQQAREIASLTAEVARLDEQLKESEKKLAATSSELQEASIRAREASTSAARIAQLEASIVQKDAMTQALLRQVDDLQKHLLESGAEVDSLRKALLEAEQHRERAKRNYDELLKTWQEYENAGEHAFVTVSADPLDARQEQEEAIRKLNADIAQLKSTLVGKEQELIALRNEAQVLKRDTELLPPLQAQLEVYKSDYVTEKEQRVAAQAQVADFQALVCELKRENTELVQQLGQRQSTQSGYAVPQLTGTVDTSLPCPVCSFRCASRRIYMDHVQNCAERLEGEGH